MKKLVFLTFLLFSICRLSLAQIKSAKLITKQPKQYQKAEWNVNLITNWTNPYLQEDVALDMLIKSPGGKKLTLPCYYESGKSGQASFWKARFAPQETGVYKYAFRLNNGELTNESSFKVKASKKDGFLHANDNWTLRFDNGKLFRGIGENIAWESRTSDDSKYFKELHQESKYNYEYMLRSLVKHGGNFYRTWICSWNLPLDWHHDFNNARYIASNEYFNPSAIRKIDRLVNLSDSLHIYVMLTLGMGNYSIKDGGFSATAADFFVNPKSKQQYKDRLRYIIARWGYSTSIGAWELFNEVDNVQFGDKEKPINADSIVAWHNEMSTFIKLTDPYKHLITTSISHRDLKGLNSLKNIDINQKHIYKNTAAIPETITNYEGRFNKPYIIGEYGYEWDWSKNFDDFAPQMDSDFKRGLWYGLFSPTPILPMSWWWEYFDNRKTDEWMKYPRAISDRMLNENNTLKTFNVIANVPETKVFALRNKHEIYIYVDNPGSVKQQGNVEIEIDRKDIKNGTSFDCNTGYWLQLPLKTYDYKNGKLIIPVVNQLPNSGRIFIISLNK